MSDTLNKYKSKCCSKPINLEGNGTTLFFVCSKCGEACDLKGPGISSQDGLKRLNAQMQIIKRAWTP